MAFQQHAGNAAMPTASSNPALPTAFANPALPISIGTRLEEAALPTATGSTVLSSQSDPVKLGGDGLNGRWNELCRFSAAYKINYNHKLEEALNSYVIEPVFRL